MTIVIRFLLNKRERLEAGRGRLGPLPGQPRDQHVSCNDARRDFHA